MIEKVPMSNLVNVIEGIISSLQSIVEWKSALKKYNEELKALVERTKKFLGNVSVVEEISDINDKEQLNKFKQTMEKIIQGIPSPKYDIERNDLQGSLNHVVSHFNAVFNANEQLRIYTEKLQNGLSSLSNVFNEEDVESVQELIEQIERQNFDATLINKWRSLREKAALDEDFEITRARQGASIRRDIFNFLIVENDPVWQERIKNELKRLPKENKVLIPQEIDWDGGVYEAVQFVESKAEAMEWLEKKKKELEHSLVILDLFIPEKKGQKAERNLGGEILKDINGKCPVVVVSSHGELHDAIMATRTDNLYFMLKDNTALERDEWGKAFRNIVAALLKPVGMEECLLEVLAFSGCGILFNGVEVLLEPSDFHAILGLAAFRGAEADVRNIFLEILLNGYDPDYGKEPSLDAWMEKRSTEWLNNNLDRVATEIKKALKKSGIEFPMGELFAYNTEANSIKPGCKMTVHTNPEKILRRKNFPGAYSVLIVEDNDDYRNSTAELFHAWGIKADSASTQGKAEGYLDSIDYHLVILDLQLSVGGDPKREGVVLARKVLEKFPSAHLIIFSSYARDSVLAMLQRQKYAHKKRGRTSKIDERVHVVCKDGNTEKDMEKLFMEVESCYIAYHNSIWNTGGKKKGSLKKKDGKLVVKRKKNGDVAILNRYEKEIKLEHFRSKPELDAARKIVAILAKYDNMFLSREFLAFNLSEKGIIKNIDNANDVLSRACICIKTSPTGNFFEAKSTAYRLRGVIHYEEQ